MNCAPAPAIRPWLMALSLATGMILVLTLATSSWAGRSSAKRAASAKLVRQGERLVAEAGRANPIDSAKIRRAIEVLNRALKIDPRNDSAYVDLGFCYSALRDGSTAVEMYRQATRLNPSPANFIELANIYLRIGQPDFALMAANAGLIKAPHNGRLLNAKGMALNDLMRFEEATEAFKKAVKYDPKLAVARSNLNALLSNPQGTGRAVRRRR